MGTCNVEIQDTAVAGRSQLSSQSSQSKGSLFSTKKGKEIAYPLVERQRQGLGKRRPRLLSLLTTLLEKWKTLSLNVYSKQHLTTNLINRQINASIRDNAQHIWQVALVKGTNPFLLHDLSGTISHSRVLACLTQCQSCLQNLVKNKTEFKS